MTDPRPDLRDVDLTRYPSEVLLDVIIRLTHMTRTAGTADRAGDYRAQRDLARAELLKRCDRAEAWEEGYDARGRDIANEGLTFRTLAPNPYR